MKISAATGTRLLAITLLLGLAACAHAPRRTAAERLEDEAIASRVEQALLSDPKLYARHIDVDAERGVVRLSGFVWSTSDLYEAERVAANVSGVTQVSSRIELMVGGRSGAR